MTDTPHVAVIVGADDHNRTYIQAVHGLYPGEDAAADAASGIIAGRAGRRAEIYPCHPPVPAWSLDQAQPGDVVRSRNVNTWYWRNEPIGGLSPWVMTAGPKGFIGSRSQGVHRQPVHVRQTGGTERRAGNTRYGGGAVTVATDADASAFAQPDALCACTDAKRCYRPRDDNSWHVHTGGIPSADERQAGTR